MKLLLAAVLFAGCAKANDIGRMEEDVVETAKSYTPIVTELSHRADELRKEKLSPEAESRLKDATAVISTMKGEIASISIPELEKRTTGKDVEQKADEIGKIGDNLETHLEHRYREATDHLGAVESWLAADERAPKVAAGLSSPPVAQ
jgi:hypothetical protein